MELLHQSAAVKARASQVARRQFSLRSLLLVMTICCVLAMLIGGLRPRSELRRSAIGGGLRPGSMQVSLDVGLAADEPPSLNVNNPDKVHVISIPGCEESSRRFHVYVPPGKQWTMGISLGENWVEGAKEFDRCRVGGGTLNASGQLVVDVGIAYDPDGRPFFWVDYGERACGSTLEEPALAVLLSNGDLTYRAAGEQTQESFAASGRIELFRFHRKRGDNAGAAAMTPLRHYRDPLTAYGVSVFLEEHLPSSQR